MFNDYHHDDGRADHHDDDHAVSDDDDHDDHVYNDDRISVHEKFPM